MYEKVNGDLMMAMENRVKPIEKDTKLEYIRAFSIIAVVTIHTVYMSILQYGDTATLSQITRFRCVMNLMWWAVPCFLMLSGSLLLNTNRVVSLEKLWKKYILRMLIVLFTFGLVFARMELFISSHGVINISQLGLAIRNVLAGESWAHMWYVYCLIGLYLLLPLWKLVADYATDRVIKYILIVMAVCGAALKLTTLFGLELGFYDHISTIYPFWFLMGIMWNRGLIRISPIKGTLMIATSSMSILILTVIQEIMNISMDAFFGYASVLVIVQSIGIYAMIPVATQLLCKKKIVKKFLLSIADKSFGIYLIHMVFINITYKILGINPFVCENAWGGLVLILCFNFIISYIVATVLKKVPLVKKLL